MKAVKKQKRTEKKPALFARWRLYVVFGTISVALISLIAHFALLQIIYPDRLIAEGDKRSVRHQLLDVPRAMITDRSGRALAVSVPVFDVWVDPQIVREQGEVDATNLRWKAVAESLNIPMMTLIQKINNNSSRFVYLARQVTPTTMEYLKQLKLSGLSFERTNKRYYPAGESVAQLIGFTNIDGVGAEGIERSLNSWLIGETGQRTVRRDRFGRVIEDIQSVQGSTAQDLVLSIDERLQNLMYKELSQAVKFNKAESGTAVLVDIRTGEILAMATSPSYNPNNRSDLAGAILRNKAVTDSFEPGSTVKPLVIMAALENKIATIKTVIDTRPFYANRFEVKDVSPQKELDLEGILTKSSNVGVSRLALQMEPHKLVEFYERFGLGKSTELGLGGEVKGTIAANRTRWSDIERATYSFGYGLTATPLQLARAYATIGSYGIYRPVSILKLDEPAVGQRVVSESVAHTVLEMMESVVLNGGGSRAAVPGYSVGVKTGTAKKVGESGKYINEYIAYTAGISPITQPRYSLVVIIDNPKAGQYYGGAVSAPVFGRIMGGVLRTMNIQPDRPLESPLIID